MRRRRCWSASAFRPPSTRPACPKGLFQNLVLDHAADREADRLRQRSITSTSPARSPAGGRSSARRPAPSCTLGLELGGKDPAYVLRRRGARPRGRQSGRRRLLQFRPVLLRHRAHLCAREASIDDFVEGFVDLTKRYVRRQSARSRRPRSGRWRSAASPTMSASRTAEALRKGASRHHPDEGPRRRRRFALSGAGSADRRQPPDER